MEDIKDSFVPLAERLRPSSLEEFVGQEHILGKDKPLRKMIESGEIKSIILWGPPGSGKTTLARLIAKYTNSHFVEFSAVTAGIDDVKRVIKEANARIKMYSQRTILFVDEIHRFNKSQQDAFLPSVEKGIIILIGATTENPGFEVNAPLISRTQVYVLNPLSDEEIRIIVNRAIKEYPNHIIDDDAKEFIIKQANGDARAALNALELAAFAAKHITLKIVSDAIQKKSIYYDKKGDWHYDTISAFIKSMRAGQVDAALHYLARMIVCGEDPLFIARRMVIFASEDIGNADPQALVLATACMQAVHMVGMPEAQFILAQTAIYLSLAPKSTSCSNAILSAIDDIDEERLEPIPLHLRNPVNKVMKELGYGKGHIRYPYKFPNLPLPEYMPKNLKGKKYYFPDK
jgi:putative ATPase